MGEYSAMSGIPAREQRLAVAAALVTVVLWASAFVGIQAAGRVLAPGALSLARLLVGTVALGLLVLVRREPLPHRADFPAILLFGLLWFGVYNIVLNQSERLVDAGTAAMLVNISPVFIAIRGGVLLHEDFPRRLVIGCAIGFAGAVISGFAPSTRGVQAGEGAVLCVV